jgi:hypothetical protein
VEGERGRNASGAAPPHGALPEDPQGCCPAHEPKTLTALETIRQNALNEGLVGLAFSGGGIRSGSVSIGFLQGLARLRLLRVFDYLSSVSGGGYASAWFAAWVRRELDRTPPPPPSKTKVGLENVELQLDPGRIAQRQATRFHQTVTDQAGVRTVVQNAPFEEQVDQEPEPVHHVRAYSNYLTPRPGVLSTDGWVLLAIYLRNTVVNLLIVLGAVVGVLALSRLLVWGYAQNEVCGAFRFGITGLTLLLPIAVLIFMLRSHFVVYQAAQAARRAPPAPSAGCESRPLVVTLMVLFVVMTAGLAVWALSPFGSAPTGPQRYWGYDWVENRIHRMEFPPLWAYALVCAGGGGLVGLFAVLFNRLVFGEFRFWVTFGSSFLMATAFGTACGLIALKLLPLLAHDPPLLAAVAPPVFLLTFVLAGFVDQWLFGRLLADYEREWRSRFAAVVLMAAAAWLVFFSITLYLPLGFRVLAGGVSRYVTGAVVVGWVSAIIGGVFAARNPRSSSTNPRGSTVLLVLAQAAPLLFLLGALGLLSWGFSAALRAALDPQDRTEVLSGVMPPPGVDWLTSHVGIGPGHFWTLLIVAGVSGVPAVGLALVANVNVFSLHALYGNRLIRCFLAASRRKGHENPQNGGTRQSAPFGVEGDDRQAGTFTGFDAADDLPLCALRPPLPGGHPEDKYDGPFPIFNAALNLVASKNLALRDVQAAAFALTPLHCGSDPTGYATTPHAGSDRFNLTLGRAMTISGAAADANMPVAAAGQGALLALLNARLGWWMQNPREGRAWTASAPRLGVFDLLYREFFGETSAESAYIHLSDGGHFDNSGVYELVRRRCRFLVVLDAAEDRNDSSENLANVIRKVRTDFGIRIEIDTRPLRKDANGLSTWHVAIGRVLYDDVDENAAAGMFVFVRSSLTGDEPADLRNYAARDPRFPHHSTLGNQLFSETQFESYRMLGEHLALSVFGDAATEFDVGDLTSATHTRLVRRFFAGVRTQWFPPPSDFDRSYIEAGKTCIELSAGLRTDPNCQNLVRSIYPELTVAAPPGTAPELTAIDQILDVMETAWLGINLSEFYPHPLHSGWMGALRRWAGSETFQQFWPVLRGEYSKGFIRFCERVLNLPPVRVCATRLTRAGTVAGAAWRAQIDLMNKEYVSEWADLLAEYEELESKRLAHAAPSTGPRCRFVPVAKHLVGPVAQALARAKDRDPLVWFFHHAKPLKPEDLVEPDGGALRKTGPPKPAEMDVKLKDYPVGALIVYPVTFDAPTSPAAAPRCYEVIFWFRGAYRSQGFGRQVMEDTVRDGTEDVLFYEHLRRELNRWHPGRTVRLLARFPVIGQTAADRLQQALWTNFFFDYDFRRSPGTRLDRFLTLEYLLTGDVFQRQEAEIRARAAHRRRPTS